MGYLFRLRDNFIDASPSRASIPLNPALARDERAVIRRGRAVWRLPTVR